MYLCMYICMNCKQLYRCICECPYSTKLLYSDSLAAVCFLLSAFCCLSCALCLVPCLTATNYFITHSMHSLYRRWCVCWLCVRAVARPTQQTEHAAIRTARCWPLAAGCWLLPIHHSIHTLVDRIWYCRFPPSMVPSVNVRSLISI